MNEDEFELSDDDSIENSVNDEMDTTMISVENNDEPANDPLATSIKVEESYVEISQSDRAALYSYLRLSGEQTESIATITVSNATITVSNATQPISTNDNEIQMHTNDPNLLNGNTINTNATADTIESNMTELSGFNETENVTSSNDSTQSENVSVAEKTGDTIAAENASNQNESIDDVELVSVLDVFPRPFTNINASGLTKYEDDKISGKLPYATKVRIFSAFNFVTFALHCIK